MSDTGAIREMRQAISQTTDLQLLKVIPVLDALPERGVANRLLDAARPRLKHLRPVRPFGLQRLLSLPLDPLITPPGGWKPGQGLVPRSALAPLFGAFRNAQPGLVATWEERLTGVDSQALAVIQEVGAKLWPVAASLPRDIPPGWGEAGLPDHVFPEIASLCLTLWRHAPAVIRLRFAGADGPAESHARPAFRLIAAEGGAAVEHCLRALLPYASRPAQLVALVAGLDLALAPPAERALDQYLEGTEPRLEGGDLATVAAAAGRFATLLADLDHSVTRDKPRRAQQLQALRMSAAKTCAQRLRLEVSAQLIEPLARVLADPAPADVAVEALEEVALALRGLSDSARRLHSLAGCEQLFEPILQRLAGLAGTLPREGPRFLRADALRLVQILASPAEAARLR